MSKLKQLIEAANRKCEMAWKVYSYNPEKDNELVDTSKAFDCIAAAQAHKRDILEKNPNYTVEIVAESMQKNEAKTIDDIRTADIAKYLKDNKKTDLKALKLKSKAFAKDLQNYFKLTSEPSVFDIDKVLDALPYFMQEAAQKNERVTSYDPNDKSHYDKNPNLVIVKKLVKEIEQERKKDAYIRDAYDPEAQLSFAYERETGKYLTTQLAKKLYKQYSNEAANIDAKNPGILEVPDGKKVNELPQSHFEKLVDKKGYAEVIRALTNLEVWNKDKNKSLSSWASNMADKLKKKFRPESAQKSKSDLKYFTYTKDKLKTKADVDKALSDMKKALAEEPNFDAKKAIQKDMEIVKSWKSQMNEDTYKVVVRDVYGSNAIIKDAKDLSQAKRLKFDLTNKYKHSPVYIIKNGEVLNESTQSNVPDKLKYFVYTKDKLKTKEDFEKALKEMKKAYYEEPSGFEKNLIDQEMAIVKTWQKQKFESAQKDLANHLLQVLSKGGATLRQLQDFESKGYSNKDLSDTLKDLVQQKKIKTSFEGGTLRYTLTESAQKNESLRDLNLELADDTNAIAASADKIRQRFEYRTLQNQSYDEKQAEKIYLEVRRELEKAKKMIDACYNKIG